MFRTNRPSSTSADSEGATQYHCTEFANRYNYVLEDESKLTVGVR